MVFSIPKREIINGKAFVIVRDDRKIFAKRKWGKDFRVDDAKRLFKTNLTFQKEVRIEILSPKVKTQEVVASNIKFLRKGNFQVRATITLEGGGLISASSIQRKTGQSIEAAKKEAELNVYKRLGEFFNEGYDEKKGRKVFKELEGATLEFDFIQYRFTKEGIKARDDRGIPTIV